MRVKDAISTFSVLTVLVVLACNKEVRVPAATSLEFNSGHCAGCLPNTEDDLFSFVVRTDADFDSLTASCFSERIKEEWFPPRPGAEEELIYVSLEGGGCEGCLDIVNVRETSQNVVVEVEGGFQGNCEKLIAVGAWALVPGTEKPTTFEFYEVICPDDL